MRTAPLCIMVLSGVFAATAAMAAATQVNIQDPNATSRVAKVEVGNRLAVQEVSPATFYHEVTLSLTSTKGCVVVAAPPAGKALIVRQIRVNVFAVSSTGPAQDVPIYLGDCNNSDFVGNVNPSTIGPYTIAFDPGLAVPNGSDLKVAINGTPEAEVYVDGYKVDSSVVPQAGGQTVELSGKPQQ